MTNQQQLDQYIKLIENDKLRNICQTYTNINGFDLVPGSSGKQGTHHFLPEGGLLIHTLEVTKLAYQMGMDTQEILEIEIDYDTLLTGSICHDLGKSFDYSKDKNGEWQTTDHYKKIKHLTRSCMMFYQAASEISLEDDIRDKIIHLINSHHFRNEWGSPVEPITVEAHILHFADYLSGKFSKVGIQLK